MARSSSTPSSIIIRTVTLWVIATFDLPDDTKVTRCAYARFRKDLFEDGLTMTQPFVCFWHCASFDYKEMHASLMGAKLPEKGEIEPAETLRYRHSMPRAVSDVLSRPRAQDSGATPSSAITFSV